VTLVFCWRLDIEDLPYDLEPIYVLRPVPSR
jgi:hypothetical protein